MQINMAGFSREISGDDRPTSDRVMIALRKIIQSLDQNSRKLVKRVGLTGPQLVLLQEIAHLGEVSVGGIARAVSLSQATVTGILERMENRGLLVKRRSQNDRRRVMVSISPKGKKVLEEAPPLMQETFVKRFYGLPEWERNMIMVALQRLVSLMDAHSFRAAPFLSSGNLDDRTARDKGGR
jgi:DNA-binding MarR family transcriptional regulator